jgi:long-chain acyl-CoA synthetase
MKDWEKINNLPMILEYGARAYPENTALSSVNGTEYSYRELNLRAKEVSMQLYAAGIRKDDRVALLAENSPHWGIAYFGILTSGAVVVPILPDFGKKEVFTIMEHSEARALFISGRMIQDLPKPLPGSVKAIFNLDTFREVDTRGREKKENVREGAPGTHEITEDHLATIIYTSGTTGNPKGVMLSHGNILSNAKQSRTIHQVEPYDRFLSVLPLAHTYECTIGLMVPLLNGARVHYIDRPPTASYLAPILKDLAPTTMLTVPLIIEKIYRARIRPALSKSPMVRFLMRIRFTRRILSRMAARKLLVFFGGQLRFFGIGGAPLAPDVERFLIDGRFPYAIGYGLTETSPMLAGFNPSGSVYRSVGTVLEGVSLRIDNPDPVTGEGEIVATGPNIMKGYYKDPERTAEVFTPDGYFRTGDLGSMDRRGILYIRGRLKNMILGPNGENIYPEEIEALINSREYVTESLVMQYKGRLVARVHLNIEALEEQFHHLKESATEFQNQLQIRVQHVLDELMVHVNQHVSRNARLQKIIFQEEPFEKTPTLKIKRFLYTGA